MLGPLLEYRDGVVTVIEFGAELKHLDEAIVAELGLKLLESVQGLPQPILLLDMHATEFFGSSFIELLFRVWKRLNSKPSAKFGISGLQPYCREVLEVTHLDRLWSLFETREAACEAMKSA